MSLFGEIIEPSSRALCDFEEDLEICPPLDLVWEGVFEPPNTVPLLICAEGLSTIELFHKSVLPDSKRICSNTTVGVQIYKITTSNERLNTFVCLLNKSNRYNDAEIVEILRPWIEKASQVISFVTSKMVDYQTRLIQEKPSVLLRMLQISSDINEIHKDKFNVPALEQPNIITGKAAAVIAYRLHIDKPGTLFVCYLDQPELDSITAEPLLKVLNQLGLVTLPYVAGALKPESNLYL